MKTTYAILACVLLLSLGFALAEGQQGSDDTGMVNGMPDDEKPIGGDTDEHGCMIAAGYSWNASEERCVREWEEGDSRYQNAEAVRAQMRVMDGEHMGEDGNRFMIQTQSENQYRLESNGVKAECDCAMTQEKVNNRTMLKVELSNGAKAEVKVMPDVAAERALERIRVRVCSEENGCSLELKEVGKGENAQLAYELKTQRRAKVLGLFGSSMEVKAQVHAENGEIMSVDKPWWAFLASEPEEA